MELDFEEILVDSLNNVDDCLDNVVGHRTNINIEKIVEAKSIVKQILQLIYLKNSKLNTDKAPDNNVTGGVLRHINPNIK